MSEELLATETPGVCFTLETPDNKYVRVRLFRETYPNAFLFDGHEHFTVTMIGHDVHRSYQVIVAEVFERFGVRLPSRVSS